MTNNYEMNCFIIEIPFLTNEVKDQTTWLLHQKSPLNYCFHIHQLTFVESKVLKTLRCEFGGRLGAPVICLLVTLGYDHKIDDFSFLRLQCIHILLALIQVVLAFH